MKPLLNMLYILICMGCSYGKEEDCICKDSIKRYITEEAVIPITTFMSEENYITIKIAFDNKDEDMNMDFITIKRKNFEITKLRETDFDYTESVNLSAPISLGWTNMNINIKKTEVSVEPFIEIIAIDFPVRQATIVSNNMASCNKGTPTWKIMRDHPVTIPLNGIARSQVSISSTKKFSPVINLNYIFGNMNNVNNTFGVIPVTSGSKLTGNIHNYVIGNYNDTTAVSHENNECEEKIAYLKLKTILKDITASTLDEDFILTLDPTVNYARTCGATHPKRTDALTITLVVLASLVILSLTSILIFIWRKRKKPVSANSKFEIEENVQLLDSNKIEHQVSVACLEDVFENSAASSSLKSVPMPLTSLPNDNAGQKCHIEQTLVHQDSVTLFREATENLETSSGLRSVPKDYDEKEKEINELREKKEEEINELREEKDKEINELREEIDKKKVILSEMLWNAAKTGSIDMLQNTIILGGDVNHRVAQGGSALNIACKEGQLTAVQKLLEAGADKELPSNANSTTPLHTSCWKGHLRIVQELVRVGANKYAKQTNGETPYDLAKRFNHRSVMIVFEKSADKDKIYDPTVKASGFSSKK